MTFGPLEELIVSLLPFDSSIESENRNSSGEELEVPAFVLKRPLSEKSLKIGALVACKVQTAQIAAMRHTPSVFTGEPAHVQ